MTFLKLICIYLRDKTIGIWEPIANWIQIKTLVAGDDNRSDVEIIENRYPTCFIQWRNQYAISMANYSVLQVLIKYTNALFYDETQTNSWRFKSIRSNRITTNKRPTRYTNRVLFIIDFIITVTKLFHGRRGTVTWLKVH